MTGEEITLTDDDTSPTGITLTANPDTVAENVQTAPTVTGRALRGEEDGGGGGGPGHGSRGDVQ